MVFNSLEYLAFFIVVFAIYWFILRKTIKGQNAFILIASYFFYGWWDWRFLSLIFVSSLTDFLCGLWMGGDPSKGRKRLLLGISLFVNLGLLIVFKYFNFFSSGFADLLNAFGLHANPTTLKVILPVGISFYTFQTLSYTIDIYRGEIKPTKDPIAFFAYVSFFPQLVAGPIERAKSLLPQFLTKREFTLENGVLGGRQILWGFFKKVAVADTMAGFVDPIFQHHSHLGVGILVLGAVLFAIQIYCDFSGYSDIAIGTCRVLGFSLLPNFSYPYLAKSVSEFWRRWHISMSSWFRDYVFTPMSIKMWKWGAWAKYAAIILLFLIIGLWHGANWTYIVFGLIHGLVVAFELLTKNRTKLFAKLPKVLVSFGGWVVTMFVWLVSMVIFRAESITEAINYFGAMRYTDSKPHILTKVIDTAIISGGPRVFNMELLLYLFYAAIIFFVEWWNKKYEFGLQRISKYAVVRYLVYLMLIYIVMDLFYGQKSFIYFQF